MNTPALPEVELRTDDRLRTGRDKTLFFLVFVIGGGLITAQKLYGASRWLPAATGAAAVVLFCGLSWITPRYRLREDRIGDSAYYLGFLFTLVSLAITLYQFTEQGGVDSVISGFGIALATTIVGLALRVIFQQLREEPMEVEQEVRRSLRDDADLLQREIRLSVEGLLALRDRVNQEMTSAVGDGLKEILRDSRSAMVEQVEVFKSSVEHTLTGVNQAVAASLTVAAETRKVTGRLLKAMDTLAEKIAQTRSPTDGFREKMDVFSSALDRMLRQESERIEKNRESADAILAVYHEMESRAIDAAAAMETCKAAVDGLHGAIGQSATAAKDMVDRSATAIDELIARNRRHLDLLTNIEEQSRKTDEFLGSLRTALEANVQQSADALLTLERQVVQASELIVKELNAR